MLNQKPEGESPHDLERTRIGQTNGFDARDTLRGAYDDATVEQVVGGDD